MPSINWSPIVKAGLSDVIGFGHTGKRRRGQQGIDKCLRRQGTDTALGMRTQGTYCKKFAGDGDAKVAVGVTRDDGPCHKFFQTTKRGDFTRKCSTRQLRRHTSGGIIMC